MPRRRDLLLLRAIGERIRALRQSRGWTQEQLASRTRLQASAVSRIESGDLGFTLSTGAALARALGVGYGRFFDEPDVATGPTTAEELALLDAWRRLPPERRRVMLELLDWCATAPLSARYVAER